MVQEKIKKKSEGFGPLAPVFLEGAEFALNNQWISVEEDLPCNHKELLNAECQTKEVFILKCGGFTDVDYILKIDGKWIWFEYKAPNFACQFPNCQKSKNKIIYYQ